MAWKNTHRLKQQQELYKHDYNTSIHYSSIPHPFRESKIPKYAKNQPAGFKNTIKRVAIISARGTIRSHIITTLLKTGKHTVTALTHKNSSNRLPKGILVTQVNYDHKATIINALKGQQFLIITIAHTAPQDTHSKLIQAAAKTGVPYIMPNGYTSNINHIKLSKDTLLGPVAKANQDKIKGLSIQ
ncbi:hypothetical protein KXX21_004763 [Aspergillus fumigatus]|nr:hypothetical protein KXX21_004763 [Aspergillus fumigatus]KMK56468.1 isoflavone reductase family protein (CipA) [Aspergillus fumigatus Z5]